MDNKRDENNFKIYLRWRQKMLIVGLIFVLVIMITEVVYYFLYYRQDGTLVNGLDNLQYLFFFFALPSFLNISIIITGIFLNRSNKISEKAKNYIVSFTLIFLCGNAISIHYVFPPLIAAICIPIFLTTVFGDKKLTVYVTLVTLGFLIDSFMKAKGIYFIPQIAGYFKEDPNLNYNYIIGLLSLTCTYIGCRVIIFYQQEKGEEMVASYKKQVELHELLKLDSLTKLYNHSSIYEIIEDNLNRCIDTNQFNLAMIDIDNFKSVNDNYGHIHGDEVLDKLARILKKYSSDRIICARYGGEEFTILFVDYTLEESFHIIEKISYEFVNTKYDFLDCNKQITFSCGLTTLSAKYISPSDFFHQADTAMYQAKAAGKNRIVYYEEK